MLLLLAAIRGKYSCFIKLGDIFLNVTFIITFLTSPHFSYFQSHDSRLSPLSDILRTHIQSLSASPRHAMAL